MKIKKTKTKKILGFVFIFAFFLVPLFAMAGNYIYTPLEEIPGQPAAPATDFYTYVSYVYRFGIAAVGIAALFMITFGGFMYITSAGNNARMESAKGVITDALAGLILALSAYLILNTINPDLVRIQPPTVPAISSTSSLSVTGTQTTNTSSGLATVGGTSPTGTTVNSICSGATSNINLCTSADVCPGTCSFSSQYSQWISTYGQQNGIDSRIIKAIICRESSGDPNAINTRGGLPSCGLMQINVNATPAGLTCQTDPRNLLDPETNIRLGTTLLAQKYQSISGFSYAGVTPYQMTFAAYNCCANRDNPNAASRDCGSSVPKWACTLNPGTSQYNMCAVRDYACTVQSCVISY